MLLILWSTVLYIVYVPHSYPNSGSPLVTWCFVQVLLLLQDGAATVESYAGLQRTAASRLKTLGTLEKSLEPQKHHNVGMGQNLLLPYWGNKHSF